MAMEVIKNKHLPLALVLMFISFIVTNYLGQPLKSSIESLYSLITLSGVIISFGLIGTGLQYLENKYIWSHLLSLEDNLSFYGVSLGAAICLMGIGKY